jgi:calcineurin-like phosphoesterase family protein
VDWFTADMHFNHGNIIKYCGRPFWSAEQMNETMIANFNSRVNPFDTVYHMGDFKFSASLQNVYELLKQLNGRWVFIRGNHDKNNGVHTILEHAVIKTFGQEILLVHRPQDADAHSILYDFVFCGHVHQLWKFRPGMVNVGVDVWDFMPVHAKQIFKAYKQWERGLM